MLLEHIVLALSWMFYGFLHSFLAATSVKTKIRLSLKSGFVYYRIFYNLISFAGLAALIWFQLRIESVWIYKPPFVILATGWLLAISGAVLMAVCVRKYFFSLSGLRSFFREAPGGKLMISGVHRYVRHPLYLGTFAFIWGLTLSYPAADMAIVAVIITVYTLIGIRFEEEKLVMEYGDDYRRYRQQVPMLIPRGAKHPKTTIDR